MRGLFSPLVAALLLTTAGAVTVRMEPGTEETILFNGNDGMCYKIESSLSNAAQTVSRTVSWLGVEPAQNAAVTDSAGAALVVCPDRAGPVRVMYKLDEGAVPILVSTEALPLRKEGTETVSETQDNSLARAVHDRVRHIESLASSVKRRYQKVTVRYDAFTDSMRGLQMGVLLTGVLQALTYAAGAVVVYVTLRRWFINRKLV